MIATFTEYIDRYIRPQGLNGNKMPGEHHFVSVYLVPRLYRLNRSVPDYVNPDGTKRITGDIVYFVDGSHKFGIEVKVEKIRLTKNEFNNWIVRRKIRIWPQIFLGVGSEGIVLLPWGKFRKTYISLIKKKKKVWKQAEIKKGYGPMMSVNALFSSHNKSGHFQRATQSKDAKRLEVKFCKAMAREIRF